MDNQQEEETTQQQADPSFENENLGGQTPQAQESQIPAALEPVKSNSRLWVIIVALVAIAGYSAVAFTQNLWAFGSAQDKPFDNSSTQIPTFTPRPSNQVESWQTYHLEGMPYSIKLPPGWKTTEGSGDSVSVHYFALPATEDGTIGPEAIFQILDFNSNYGEVPPKEILNQTELTLDTKLFYRQTIIDRDGKQKIRVRTKNAVNGSNIIISLENLSYIDIFDQVLSTFKFTDSVAGFTKIREDQRFTYYDGSVTISGNYREILYPTIW